MVLVGIRCCAPIGRVAVALTWPWLTDRFRLEKKQTKSKLAPFSTRAARTAISLLVILLCQPQSCVQFFTLIWPSNWERTVACRGGVYATIIELQTFRPWSSSPTQSRDCVRIGARGEYDASHSRRPRPPQSSVWARTFTSELGRSASEWSVIEVASTRV